MQLGKVVAPHTQCLTTRGFKPSDCRKQGKHPEVLATERQPADGSTPRESGFNLGHI